MATEAHALPHLQDANGVEPGEGYVGVREPPVS